jgi:hypothetical protein
VGFRLRCRHTGTNHRGSLQAKDYKRLVARSKKRTGLRSVKQRLLNDVVQLHNRPWLAQNRDFKVNMIGQVGSKWWSPAKALMERGGARSEQPLATGPEPRIESWRHVGEVDEREIAGCRAMTVPVWRSNILLRSGRPKSKRNGSANGTSAPSLSSKQRRRVDSSPLPTL